MISKEKYLEAKSIVTEYEQELSIDFQRRLELVREDLQEYFKDNLVQGQTVTAFSLTLYGSKHNAYIKFMKPYFDENYWGERDEDFLRIGSRHGIHLKVEPGHYPK